MSRLHALAMATAAFVACGLSAAAFAGTPATGGWVATSTQALSLSGQLLGAAPSGEQLEISAVLPLRNTSSIPGMIEARDDPHPRPGSGQLGPTSTTVSAVESYLTQNGFTNVSASGNNLLVTGDATVAQAEQAFDTSISDYDLGGQTVYANTAPATSRRRSPATSPPCSGSRTSR